MILHRNHVIWKKTMFHKWDRLKHNESVQSHKTDEWRNNYVIRYLFPNLSSNIPYCPPCPPLASCLSLSLLLGLSAHVSIIIPTQLYTTSSVSPLYKQIQITFHLYSKGFIVFSESKDAWLSPHWKNYQPCPLNFLFFTFSFFSPLELQLDTQYRFSCFLFFYY